MKTPSCRVTLVAVALWSCCVASAPAQEAAAPATSDDPAVLALLATRPSTPDDLMNVVGLLLDLDEPRIAQPLLVQLMQAADDDAQRNVIGRKYGTKALFRLASTPELQPQGKEFADAVLASMRSTARDPARIAALIGRLQDPSLDVRAQAISGLRDGGDTATQIVVEALLSSQNAGERRMLEIALAGMGDSAYGPVGAMLTSGDAAAMASAVAVLQLVEDPAVLNDLLIAAYAPNSPAELRTAAATALAKRLNKTLQPMEAAGRLLVAAEGLYKKQSDDAAEPHAVWSWDSAAMRPTVAMLPRRIDELNRAARYADVAAEISGGDRTAWRLSRQAALDALLMQQPDAQAARSAAATFREKEALTRGDLEAMIDQAAAADRTRTAALLVEMLGTAGTRDELLTAVGGRPTALVRAAVHADPTIRFAAVASIMQLQPTAPFAGSSGVADSLAWFATAEGADRALVVDARNLRGRDLAAMLSEQNLRAEAVDDVRTALPRITSDGDAQLIFIDRVLLEPSMGNLLARLRADFRTARTPVVVLCEPETLNRTRTRLYDDPFTLALFYPATAEHLTTQLRLNELPGAAFQVPGNERLQRAHFALAAMQRLLETKNAVFSLRAYEDNLVRAAASGALAKPAVGVLGAFGSATAQRTLVDTAAATARPLDLRQAAATAFCESVIRYGTLLTTDEIARQYDRYNASESLDAETQGLLAAILDAVEARAAKIPASAAGQGARASVPTP